MRTLDSEKISNRCHDVLPSRMEVPSGVFVRSWLQGTENSDGLQIPLCLSLMPGIERNQAFFYGIRCVEGSPTPARLEQPQEQRGISMSKDQALREHLLYLLGGGGAHLAFGAAVAGLPAELLGTRAERLP